MKLTMLKKAMVATVAIVTATQLTACNQTGAGNTQIDGLDYSVEFAGGNVLLGLVMKNVHIEGGLVLPIPKYPNSSLQVGPDFLSDGTLIMLTINAADFLGVNGKFFDPQKLPDGRPLPSVAEGQLPAVAVQIPKLFNSVLYVGPTVIGFFVPMKLINNTDAILTFRFNDKNNKPVGIIGLVGGDEKLSHVSGFLAMMRSDLLGLGKSSAMSMR